MKRKAKRGLILAAVCLLVSANAGAAMVDSLKLNVGRVEVCGSSSAERISYKVYEAQKTGTQIGDICELGEAAVSEGKFSFEFLMPKTFNGAETDGEYIIDIKDGTKTSQTFLFTGASYRKAFISDLNLKTTAAELVSFFDGKSGDNAHDNIDIMCNFGIDGDYYKSLDPSKKNSLAQAFLNEKGTDAITEENFYGKYNGAQAVQYLNGNAVSESWLEGQSLEFENTSYKDADSDVKKWILEVVGDGTKYNSYSDIEKKYREANVLYLLDKAKFTDYDALIASYDDAIGITNESYYTTYKNMKPLNQSNVNAALKNAIANKKPATAAEFKAAYKKAIEDETNKISSQGGSSGGGGGGGGTASGGGVPTIMPEKTNPTKLVSEFSDIDSAVWAKEAIMALAGEGIVSGYDDGTFKPQQSIKREEFVKMVISAAHIDLNKPACNFDDVEQDKWYAQYVNAAFEAGVISGISESSFGVGSGIKREDMAVIIARLTSLEDAASDMKFYDDGEISDYARESVYKLYNAGKIAGVGDNEFAPKAIVTRAQAAKIIYDTLVSGN